MIYSSNKRSTGDLSSRVASSPRALSDLVSLSRKCAFHARAIRMLSSGSNSEPHPRQVQPPRTTSFNDFGLWNRPRGSSQRGQTVGRGKMLGRRYRIHCPTYIKENTDPRTPIHTSRRAIRNAKITDSIHLPELLQKSHVVLKQIPDVVDLVHQRCHAVQTETECET